MVKKKEVGSDKTISKHKDKPLKKKAVKKTAKNSKKKNKDNDDNTDSNVELPPEVPLKDKPVLEVKSLSKKFRKRLVLRDVTFEVFGKDIFGVVGMSGSGKTTLFQLMAGVINQTSGDVLVRRDVIFENNNPQNPDYISVYKNQSRSRRQIGFASQTPSFYEYLTIEENLKLYGSLYGMSSKKINERSKELLRLVGLSDEEETIAAQLSGGMQRRLDIACALIHEPKILFLDEPTSDLDPLMRTQLWSLIKDINEKGTTILIASHILEEVEQLCTKIAILNDKHIVGYGSLDELKSLFARFQEVRIRLASGNYEQLMKKLRKESFVIERMFEKEGMLVVYTQKESKNLSKILRLVERIDEQVTSLDVSEAHLSEIFEMLAKKKPVEE